MRHLLKTLSVLILVLVAAGAVLLVRQRRAELDNMETAALPSLPVIIAEARQGKIEAAKHYIGFIEPEESAVLAARITGRLQAVRIDTGDRVEKNDPVALIDDREPKKSFLRFRQNSKAQRPNLQTENSAKA
ncbi:MAG: hypothetical protein ACLFNW_11255 [Desulfobacterales bacterium]